MADASHCSQCGRRMPPETAAMPIDKACPACSRPMQLIELGDVPAASCPGSRGVWLDRATFERICAEREAQTAVLSRAASAERAPALPPAARVRYRRCPFCGKMMNRVNFARHSGIVLDVCKAHGTFFDQDDLPGVVGFIARGGMSLARQKEREDLEESERRLRALSRVPRLSHHAHQADAFKDEALDALLRDLLGL